MRKSQRSTALLPALAAASLLVAGCSAASPSPAAAGGDAEPKGGASPAAAPAPQLAVQAAPARAAGAPSAVARPSGGGRQAQKSSLKIASFDRKSGRAVISGASDAPKKPTAGHGTPPKATPPKSAVAVGDVIASAPAPGAPNGVLAKVTKVLGKTEQGTEVNTAPATLGALLGDAKADGKVPVDPAAMKVEPLLRGTKVSWAKTGDVRFGPQGGKVPLGSLRIDVGASVPTAKGAPVSAEASVAGFVQLAPEVDFSYNGGGFGSAGSPGTASLGLSGDWSSQWELKGQAAGSTKDGKPLRLPFAKLHAAPVIQVGPVPVVVNVDLTCYLQVDGDGRIGVDVKQSVKGDFRVGGDYTRGKGWSPVSKSDLKATPVVATATAAGQVKATLGAEAAVGLYGMAGVNAELAPYLRAEAEGSATGASDGTASATGRWAAFGGFDLSGALQAQLRIFGTPIFEKRIPLGSLHREWKLGGGQGSVSTAPRAKGPKGH
ncbi:hypothetical protein [Streptomyces syringium]|uniref:hypothetical protein n=1 Tax=Streptomyces syringium TaxID=76729 RepID=UPI0033D2EB29